MKMTSGKCALPLSLERLAAHLQATPPPLPAHARPAAVLLPLVPAEEGPAVLLTVRRRDLAHHPGQVCLPGGGIEPGESPLQAALREAEEETGLPPKCVQPLGFLPLCETGTGFAITPLVGIVESPLPLRPNPSEVAALFTLPLSRLIAPGAFTREAMPGGRRPWYWVIRWQEHCIWGATATILREFRTRLLAALTKAEPAARKTPDAATHPRT